MVIIVNGYTDFCCETRDQLLRRPACTWSAPGWFCIYVMKIEEKVECVKCDQTHKTSASCYGLAAYLIFIRYFAQMSSQLLMA